MRQPLSLLPDIFIHSIRRKVQSARPSHRAIYHRYFPESGWIAQVRKNALKEFRRETYNAFEAIGKTHPDGTTVLKRTNFGDSPRGCHFSSTVGALFTPLVCGSGFAH